ncbi:hypothetical protein [Haloferula sp. A504]|uniref:hypothetical protein n=1 Tax=Haloferula sp. A504 TaxID=3373601 RepID=UPI0031BDD1D1|nr:hypothetical protein [Verrucomicrobiaceae bacterium E54]
MKQPSRLLFLCCLAPCLHAQETYEEDQATTSPIAEVFIPGPIVDGTPPQPPPAPPGKPDFEVVESRTSRMNVVEPPPMHGLPAVTGTVNVTLNRVEDPKLPPLPEPLPATTPTDPAVLAATEEFRRDYKGTELFFISATVYDRSRTYLRIYPNGVARKEITAWSNIDFNHFSGFSTFRVTREDGSFTDHGMLMGLGNQTAESTERLRELLEQNGMEYSVPEVPDLPDLAVAGPRYVIVEGGDVEDPACEILAYMHRLYATDGARMEAAYIERERVRKEREAYYLANPPKPKDVTINFWRTKKEDDQ